MIISILIAYAGLSVFGGLALVLMTPNFKLTVGKTVVRDPVMKVLGAILLIAILIPLTILGLPIHILLKLFGRRGFWNPQTNNWTPFGSGSLGRN